MSPSFGRRSIPGFGSARSIVGGARFAVDAIRGVQPQSILDDLDRELTIEVVARDADRARIVSDSVFDPRAATTRIQLETVRLNGTLAERADPVVRIVIFDARHPDWHAERAAIHAMGVHAAIAVLADPAALPHPPSAADVLAARLPSVPRSCRIISDDLRSGETRAAIGAALLEHLPGHRLALGAEFPRLRGAIADRLILDAAWENARLGLLSSVPSFVPFLGNAVSAAADLLTMTQSQAHMVLRLAALHGRPIDEPGRVIRELAPVVGGAFVWRTIVRTATSFLPAGAGVVPKTAVAFVGTYLTGKTAHAYYQHGGAPTPEVVQSMSRAAWATFARRQTASRDAAAKMADGRIADI
jgi:uncharacterized protein (DUF697 family)